MDIGVPAQPSAFAGDIAKQRCFQQVCSGEMISANAGNRKFVEEMATICAVGPRY
jgi:hypothetical protein